MRDRSFRTWPFFDDAHRRFADPLGRWLDAQPIDTSASPEESCRDWIRAVAEGGWLAPCIDLDVRRLCIAREMLAYHDALGDFAFAMQGLGSGAITLFGSDDQKARFLGGVASGETIMAFALSEQKAGSDVGAIATRARRDGDCYVIDGEKSWISNAGIADRYVLFARTAHTGAKGLSAFVVDAETPGLTVSERIETISPHPLGNLRFKGYRIPAYRRLGEEGDGFRIAMATLDVFRPTVGAAALGFARRALDESVAHVNEGELFGARGVTRGEIVERIYRDVRALRIYEGASEIQQVVIARSVLERR